MKFLIPFIESASNALLRGSDYIRFGRYIHVVLFGLMGYYVSKNWLFSLSITIAMMIGQMFAIPHNQTLAGNWKPMFFRGILWCLPLILVTAYFYGWVCLSYLPAALLMYPVYRGSDLFFEGRKQTEFFNQVRVAEHLYGFLIGLGLDAIGVQYGN